MELLTSKIAYIDHRIKIRTISGASSSSTPASPNKGLADVVQDENAP